MTDSINVETLTGHTAISTVPDDVTNREESARKERMAVIPVVDTYGYATGEYLVFSESGSRYDVDMESRGGKCPCPDFRFNEPSEGCKHLNRVGAMLYETDLPEPDERAEDFLYKLVDAEESLRERLDAIEAGDIETTNIEEDYIRHTLSGIDYIHDEMPFELD